MTIGGDTKLNSKMMCLACLIASELDRIGLPLVASVDLLIDVKGCRLFLPFFVSIDRLTAMRLNVAFSLQGHLC